MTMFGMSNGVKGSSKYLTGYFAYRPRNFSKSHCLFVQRERELEQRTTTLRGQPRHFSKFYDLHRGESPKFLQVPQPGNFPEYDVVGHCPKCGIMKGGVVDSQILDLEGGV